jgi:nucleoside-diphosphate-sugar epimerase
MVTGIGHIGGYVVRDLLASGQRVVVYGFFGGTGAASEPLPDLDYLDYLLGGNARDKVEVEIGDITDLEGLTRAAERHSVRKVVHLASLISSGAEANPALALRVNVGGTVNVFEAAARLGLDKVVWASSVEVFGERSVNESGVVDDDSPPDPVFIYGAGKLMGEKLAIRYAADHGTDITGLRLSRVYGFGEHVKAGRGGGSSWLSSLLYQPAVGVGPSVVPFGSRHLDFHYIEDVSTAFMTALDFENGQGRSYLTHGDYRPMAEAFEFVRTLLPDATLTLSMDDIPLPPGSSLGWSRRYDASRAEREVGITRTFAMETGIYRTVNANRVYAGLPAIPEPDLSGMQPTAEPSASAARAAS